MITKIIKASLLVALCIAIFCSGYLISQFGSLFESSEPKHQYSEIYFSSQDTRLYFVVITWGLLGQHSKIIITTNNPQEKDWKFNADRDYNFNAEELFYKPQGDSLIIYSNLVLDSPKNFNSDIVLVLKKLAYDEQSRMIYYDRERSGFSKIGI